MSYPLSPCTQGERGALPKKCHCGRQWGLGGGGWCCWHAGTEGVCSCGSGPEPRRCGDGGACQPARTDLARTPAPSPTTHPRDLMGKAGEGRMRKMPASGISCWQLKKTERRCHKRRSWANEEQGSEVAPQKPTAGRQGPQSRSPLPSFATIYPKGPSHAFLLS